jgi:hypothetical protein
VWCKTRLCPMQWRDVIMFHEKERKSFPSKICNDHKFSRTYESAKMRERINVEGVPLCVNITSWSRTTLMQERTNISPSLLNYCCRRKRTWVFNLICVCLTRKSVCFLLFVSIYGCIIFLCMPVSQAHSCIKTFDVSGIWYFLCP